MRVQIVDEAFLWKIHKKKFLVHVNACFNDNHVFEEYGN